MMRLRNSAFLIPTFDCTAVWRTLMSTATGGVYQPVDDGRPAIIVPVFDAYELIDLLAFDPRKPEQWWLRVGAVPLLGSDALGEQLLGKPLRVFKTPLAWLLAGLDGVVILDLQRAFPDLSAAQYGLAAENPTHERELRKALAEIATRRLPHVLVQALEREVA